MKQHARNAFFTRRDAVDEAGDQQLIRPLQLPTEGCRMSCIGTDGSGCRSLGLRSACGRSSFRRSEHTFALAPLAACAGRALRTPIPMLVYTLSKASSSPGDYGGRRATARSRSATAIRSVRAASWDRRLCAGSHAASMAECLGPPDCAASKCAPAQGLYSG